MIGPVYGKNRSTPLGIIQFINKLHDKPINEEDIKKFNDMADLIGLCVENTMTITQTIGVTLKINERMENITKIMDVESRQDKKYPTMAILDELLKKFSIIKQQSGKLMDDRQ